VDDLRQGVRSRSANRSGTILWISRLERSEAAEPRGTARGTGPSGGGTSSARDGEKYLGDTFDFHGGGQDLVFPITRTRSRSPKARRGSLRLLLIENGLVLLRGAKMSKSDQHFFLVEDVAKKVERR